MHAPHPTHTTQQARARLTTTCWKKPQDKDASQVNGEIDCSTYTDGAGGGGEGELPLGGERLAPRLKKRAPCAPGRGSHHREPRQWAAFFLQIPPQGATPFCRVPCPLCLAGRQPALVAAAKSVDGIWKWLRCRLRNGDQKKKKKEKTNLFSYNSTRCWENLLVVYTHEKNCFMWPRTSAHTNSRAHVHLIILYNDISLLTMVTE